MPVASRAVSLRRRSCREGDSEWGRPVQGAPIQAEYASCAAGWLRPIWHTPCLPCGSAGRYGCRVKRIGIIQSNYIPWKGYFDIIHDVDLFVFHDDLQYTKGDWRNRNRIKTADGERWLTIPVR